MKRFLLTLFLGVVLGALGMSFLPPYLTPYLPEMLKPTQRIVEGQVVAKRMSPEGLLLTIETPEGAVLATFTTRTEEIDLLVNKGDYVAFGLKAYKPFLQDPEIARVRKAERLPPEPPAATEPVRVPEPASATEPPAAEPEAATAPKEAAEPSGDDPSG